MSPPLLSLPPLAASTLSDPSSEAQPGQYNFNSKVMVAAMLILCIVVFFVISLHVYAKWFWHQGRAPSPLSNSSNATWRRRRRLPPGGFTATDESLAPTICVGLDPSTISSLPTFIYQASCKHRQHDAKEPLLECAVCLSEFQPYEKGRILPNCKHSFHIGCIDMWFRSHSTCPLCRAPVSLWTPQQQAQNTWLRSDSTAQGFLLVLPTSHQQDEQTASHSMLQRTSMNQHPDDQSTGFTPPMPIPQGHIGFHVQGQHKEGFANDDELMHRHDIQVEVSETLDGACLESCSTSAASVHIQGPLASIARCHSLGMPRCRSEDTEVCILRPIKSQSFRMSIRWLLSRDLSRGRGRIFPSAAGDQGQLDHHVEQSSNGSNLPL